MCVLCQQLGIDFHKLSAGVTDGAADGASVSWAALPGGSGADLEGPGSDTVVGSTGTSSTMSGGTSVRGYINANGDQDWYAVTLTAGQTYTFALSGFGRGALSDAYLRLLNSSGTQLAFDDDSGPLSNSKLTFTASTSGTYYISAEGYGGTTTGQYLLTMATGTTPYAPTVTVSDIADYLTNSYWEVNGSVAHHWGVSTISYNVQGLTADRAALARVAFQLWSEVANLTFVETSGTGKITLDDTQSGAYASSNYGSNGIITSANINVETTWYGSSSAIDSYTLQTFIHEIGHALGLGHAGPYNGSATYGVDNTYGNDTWQYTLMSYMAESNFGGASYRFTMTPMMADILAIQNLYGAPTTRTGDTVYGFGSTAGSMYNFSTYSQAPSLTIYDSGGTDTLNASGYSQNQVINLTGGSFSNIGGLVGNISIYTTSMIENAIGGSGADTITGSTVANVLTGGAGADTLAGLAGDDTLIGGAGNDTIDGGLGNDTAAFTGLMSQYQITRLSGGAIQVVDQRSGSPDGTDLLTNVEFFQFADVLYSTTNQAPVVTPVSTTRTMTAGQDLLWSDLFSVNDPEGDAIVKYYVSDSNSSGVGGWYIGNTAVTGLVDPSQLANLHYHASGSGTETIYFQANDDAGLSTAHWSNWQNAVTMTVTGGAVVNLAPVVTPGSSNQTMTAGQDLSWSSLFSVNDPEGNAIVKYYVSDSNSSGVGGWYIGNTAVTGLVDPSQLANLHYHASGAGTETVYFQANDDAGLSTAHWSNWQNAVTMTVTGGAVVNLAPVVTPGSANRTMTAGQDLSWSSLFSVNDPEGNAIVKYYVGDSNSSGVGGWYIGNTAVTGLVDPSQLANLHYHASGAGTETIYFQANDDAGLSTAHWSNWQNAVTMTVAGGAVVNLAPVVTPVSANRTMTAGQDLLWSDLFSVNDPEGNAIVKYYVSDSNSSGIGGWYIGNTAVTGLVDPSQLANLHYHASGAGTETIYFQANDDAGLSTAHWSNWQNAVTMTVTTSNQAPVVTPVSANRTMTAGQDLLWSDLFSVNDPEGNAIAKYYVSDTNANGVGGWFVGNTAVRGLVDPSQLASLHYHATASGSETIYFQANDDAGLSTAHWSNWQNAVTILV